MAIRKDKSSVFVKVVIIVVAVSFVLTGISVVFAPTAQTGQQKTATTGANTIAAKNKPGVDAALAATQANPKDYNAFVQLGNAYYDWAAEESQARTGADQPIWVAAATAYKQAVALKAGDPNVTTDLAISQYYSLDASGAIATIEPVLKSNPEHANAAMNASIFYQAVGATPKAVAVLETFLAKNPKSSDAKRLQERLAELKSSGSTPATGTAPATTTP